MSQITRSTTHNFNELFEYGIEEALQQSVLDFFPGIIYVYDLTEKKLTYVNKRISELLGYAYEDFKEWNLDLTKLIFKDDVEALSQELEKFKDLKDEESHSYDCRFNRKQGDWVHFYVTGKIIRRDEKGLPSTLLFMAKDTSEQVKAIEELRAINIQIKEKEELLAGYKEHVDIKEEFLECGSWKFGAHDKAIIWSDGMYRLFGYDPEVDRALLAVNDDLYRSHMSPADFEGGMILREHLAGHMDHICREYEIITKSGETKTIETLGRIIRDDHGKIDRLVGTSRNITQLKNSEREKERNIDNLKRSVTNLEDFTYIASHDIQEPLRKIATFSERMKEKFTNDLNDEAKNYLDRILNTSRNAHLLIDGLMGFLKLDHQYLPFKRTNLNVLVDEVKIELELLIEESHVTILVKPLPVIEAISLQIKQLLVNLMLNSIKFRNADSLLLIEIESQELSPEEVKINQLEAGVKFYRISVKDNGVGFREGLPGKMFQMFQRFHNKADYPGAGIGLAICKKIIDKHNGLIFAKSVPGHGATFSFILPDKQSTRAAA